VTAAPRQQFRIGKALLEMLDQELNPASAEVVLIKPKAPNALFAFARSWR